MSRIRTHNVSDDSTNCTGICKSNNHTITTMNDTTASKHVIRFPDVSFTY